MVFNDNLKYTIRIKQDKTFEIIKEDSILNYITFRKFDLASDNDFIAEYDDLCKIINGGLTAKTIENIENILINGIPNNLNNQICLPYGLDRKMKLYLSEESIDNYRKRIKKSLKLLEEIETEKLLEEALKKKLAEDRNKRIKGGRIIISDGTNDKTYFAIKIMD